MIIESILLVSVLVLMWWYLTGYPEGYPATPPIRLPVIGHGLYLLGYRNTQEAFNDLCHRYGKDGMMVNLSTIVFKYNHLWQNLHWE